MSNIHSRYSFGESTDTVTVDLFGRDFELRPITKSVSAALEQLDQANAERFKDRDLEADPLTDEEQIAFWGGILDAILKPAGSQRKPASAVLTDAWDRDLVEITAVEPWVLGLRRGPGFIAETAAGAGDEGGQLPN